VVQEKRIIDKKVALITGGSGFLGRALIRHLLSDDYHVILLLRNKTVYGKVSGQIKSAIPAKGRHSELAIAVQANGEEHHRIHIVEADIAAFSPTIVAREIRQLMLEKIEHHSIDFCINCAGRLTMDYEQQEKTQKENIQKRNLATNVNGLENFLEVIRILGHQKEFTAPSARIIRPSIIAGKGSKDAYMAFLDYLGKGVGPFSLVRLARLSLRLKPNIIIPMPANPDGILDIIDIKDVIGAMMAFIRLDQPTPNFMDKNEAPANITIRTIHHVSTCYVHGESVGRLMEKTLHSDMTEFKNSYEATKAAGEGVLEAWNKKWGGDTIRYNQVSNPLAPTTQRVIQETLFAFGFSEQEAARVKTVVPGMPFDNAMERLRATSALAGWLVQGLWNKVPMLSTYLNRKDATVFNTDNTVQDLSSVGQTFAPEKFSAEWIKRELLNK
jgi:NAD(P)-dependent dehydrogenase (short-subunit alcohol dehydrogenase family)